MVEHSKSSLVLVGYVSNYQCMSEPVEEVRFLCPSPFLTGKLVTVRFPFLKPEK